MEKYLDVNISFEERAADLVSRMTVQECAEQLKYDAPSVERLGIPSYNWWNEGLHGVARAGTATMFPQAIALAAMFDSERVNKAAEVISTEARAKYSYAMKHNDHGIYKGLTLWSPNVNIFRDARWGRGHETYGEDPYLTAELGKAFVKGLQGNGKHLKTAACAKHYAVHSGPENLRHQFNAEVSEKDLWETYLYAFGELVEKANVESVMGAYNRTNGEPCCASERLMDILRGQWGFKGHFLSDCWAIADFHTHHNVTKTAPESAALALKNGCDLNCGSTYLNMMIAYNDGLVSEEDIRTSCKHLMETRIKLGMYDKTEYDDIPFDTIDCAKHNRLNLECAERSIVLLKNNGILPLNREKIKTIGVIGPNADSREILKGNYNGTASCYTTFLDGIREESEDIRVYYSEGCHLYRDKVEGIGLPDDRLSEAMAVAENSDVVVLCLGLDANIEGEEGDQGNPYSGGDKPNLLLPEPQRHLLAAVLSVNRNVIVVNASGSAIDLSTADEKAAAVVQTWYTGSLGGKALAEVLFGKVSPSGKLPVTFYKSTDDIPEFTDYSMKNRTYRYIEAKPLYPFGYGLSYGKARIKKAEYVEDGVKVQVANESEIACEEVLQAYVKHSSSEYAPLNGSLWGFKRISIGAGETMEFIVPLSENAFTVVNDKGERNSLTGEFNVFVGFGQNDERTNELMESGYGISLTVVK